jgi:ferredoxin/flavodoxin---NADP+ reductase
VHDSTAPLTVSPWIEARVIARRQWTPALFSLQIAAPGFAPFQAGQFVRVGLPGDAVGEMIGRPYSLVNAPDQSVLEIYAIAVASGLLSPRLNALRAGDAIYVMPRANGFFSISEIPAAQNLWCLATGTGLGPYLSMLQTPAPWQQFSRVILVHGARHADELTYGDTIAAIQQRHGQQFSMMTLTSRDEITVQPPHATTHLRGRITDAFLSGTLEQSAACAIDDAARVMLCGNPAMVGEMMRLMALRGLRKHRKREPGHFIAETYWDIA